MDDHDDSMSPATLPDTKRCPGCGEVKLREAFGRHARERDGLQPRCKVCRAAHYAENRERIAAQKAAYYAENAERVAIRNAAYYTANRERASARQSAWRAENAERIAAYDAENRERRAARQAAYRGANRERIAARQAAYAVANPDLIREHKALRRARKLAAPVVERIYRAEVWARDGGKCHICKRQCDPNDWHMEHIVPLSRGGDESYQNVAVSHPACNLRKGVRGPGQMRLIG